MMDDQSRRLWLEVRRAFLLVAMAIENTLDVPPSEAYTRRERDRVPIK